MNSTEMLMKKTVNQKGLEEIRRFLLRRSCVSHFTPEAIRWYAEEAEVSMSVGGAPTITMSKSISLSRNEEAYTISPEGVNR